MSVLVPAALVTSSSFSSGSVSTDLTICIEMSGSLDTGSTIYSGSLREVIRGPVAHSVKFSSHCTTCQNSSELVEGISHPWEHHCLANLESLVYVVLFS